MTTFTITFHAPFHVGTGDPGEGLDRRVDPENLLPATSLKGLMRASLIERLKIDASHVDPIFGAGGRTQAAWRWSDAEVDLVTENPHRVARIVIDDSTGTADDHLLMFGEEMLASNATFTVEPAVELNEDTQRDHEFLLRASAMAVSSLGGNRRRGEGWVTIETTADPWTDTDTARLLDLRSAS